MNMKRKEVKKYRDMNMKIETKDREWNGKWGWEVGGFAVYDCLLNMKFELINTSHFFTCIDIFVVGLEYPHLHKWKVRNVLINISCAFFFSKNICQSCSLISYLKISVISLFSSPVYKRAFRWPVRISGAFGRSDDFKRSDPGWPQIPNNDAPCSLDLVIALCWFPARAQYRKRKYHDDGAKRRICDITVSTMGPFDSSDWINTTRCKDIVVPNWNRGVIYMMIKVMMIIKNKIALIELSK